MDSELLPARPFALGDGGPPPVPGEAARLARLARAGLALAPTTWIPAEAEEGFYRWNHLPARLAALFAPVASRDPDEDDVEDLAEDARALLARHAMLDAWVDDFYDAIAGLPSPVRVRRPDDGGRVAARGRPALLALRAVWADAWSDAAVLGRLRATGSVALAEGPALVQGADDRAAPGELASRVAAVLGARVEVRVDGGGRIVRLGSAARPEGGEREG